MAAKDKVVLLILVGLLFDRPRRLEIFQRGRALDLRSRRRGDCDRQYEKRNRIFLTHGLTSR
jgi:hypothetical protein